MIFDMKGKVALVTGGGRGLGFAIAGALHRAGAIVGINDRNEAIVGTAIELLGGGDRLIPAPADLANATGAARAIQPMIAQARLDLLVNNAAINIEKPIAETDDDHWDRHLAIDLKAAFFTIQAALPILAQAKGCVINIASELGVHAIANNVAYVAAKHGLLALTRALAIELAASGIRVNALCPGTMDTELMRDCAEASSDPAAYYRDFEAYHPLARLAKPEEIAAFVLCLASPAAAFMTGSSVVLDGGSVAGRI